MNGQKAYGATVRLFSVAFLVLGAVLIVRTIHAGGGPLAIGTITGVLLVAIGVARLWIMSHGTGKNSGSED